MTSLKIKIIYNENSRPYASEIEKESGIQFNKRFLFKTTPVETTTAEDFTLIVMLKKEPLVILIKDKDSIAIEVPIWSVSKDNHLTGHIDLIQIEDNIIKIIDYKPEGNFLFSLPQVATYGLLIKELIHVEKINCISFNKNFAWEYNPEILLTELK